MSAGSVMATTCTLILCPICEGAGATHRGPCATCNATGSLPTTMRVVVAEQRPGHAPGWHARRDTAGQVDRPWGDRPAALGGLCEAGWHTDCPQAPVDVAGPGRCLCPCHQDRS